MNNPSSTPAQDDRKLVAIITRVTVAIAIMVALSPPPGYFWLSYQAQKNEVAMGAKLHAAFVTQVIVGNPTSWRAEIDTLIEHELTPSALPEVRSVKDALERLIARSQGKLDGPVVTAAADLLDANGSLTGHLEVARSLAPVLRETFLVALLSATLGIAIFITLRVLPLRALKRALSALHQEKQTLQENEERLRIVIDKAVDGIVTLDPHGVVESFNPAAERIFGYRAAEIIGQNIGILIPFRNTGKGPDGAAPTAGQREVVATYKDGATFPVEFSLSEAHLRGEQKLIAILRDITERKTAQDKLAYLANYDSLTGLPNRSLFRDRLSHAMSRASRNNHLAALMFLDLDRFKNINDSLGHDVGDSLLKHVANLLQNCLRRSDTICRSDGGTWFPEDGKDVTVSRLGGDEFTLILEGIANGNDAAIAAQNILAACAEHPFQVGDKKIYASTSIGIALYPIDNTDLDGLIKQADAAMYRSKELGRNIYQFYTEELNTKANQRLSLETDMQRAVERQEFLLHYQPKLHIASGEITGIEALLRWQRPDSGLIPPDEFIPMLEETGLILPVGEWVLRTACNQLKTWHDLGLDSLSVAVNLSARQFSQKDLVEKITRILDDSGLPATSLELEVTESLLMEHTDASVETLIQLKNKGISISVDDFGTGYSSLSYLKRFPVDTLKIDRSFVRDITVDPDDAAIASAVIALAHSLRLAAVAEGVETEEQLKFMRGRNCDQMQGYLLSRPLPAEAFDQWIRARMKMPS